MFTCVIRYTVDLEHLDAFEAYGKAWIELIEDYGGTHHGYFLPDDGSTPLPDPSFSFPGLGEASPASVAYALFSFPDVEAYERYRREVAEDPRCLEASRRFEARPCFSGYERAFLRPLLPSARDG
mgnify:CR=1 FL=1